MKLWGQVASGLLLVMAVVFMAVAYGIPEGRWEAIAAAAISGAAALFGVPALVRLFSSFTGDEELLANGLPYSATLISLEPTRWRYNRYYPIVKFRLNVNTGAPYPVDIKQAVDPALLPQLAPGTTVDVCVDRKDPKKVVISWPEVARQSTDPAIAAVRTATTLSRLGVILVLLSLFFAALAYEEWRYETRGVIVQGTATGISGKREWAYEFTVGGQILQGETKVLPDTASKLKPGGRVDVQYLSDSPQTNRIPGQRASYATWRAMTVAAFIAGIALRWRARRQRQAQMKP